MKRMKQSITKKRSKSQKSADEDLQQIPCKFGKMNIGFIAHNWIA